MAKITPNPSGEYAEAHMFATLAAYVTIQALYENFKTQPNADRNKSIVMGAKVTIHESGWAERQPDSDSGDWVSITRLVQDDEDSEPRHLDSWELIIEPTLKGSTVRVPPDADAYAQWSKIREKPEQLRPSIAVFVAPTGDEDKPFIGLVSTITSEVAYIDLVETNNIVDRIEEHEWSEYDLEMWNESTLSPYLVKQLASSIRLIYESIDSNELRRQLDAIRGAVDKWIKDMQSFDGRDIQSILEKLASISNGVTFKTDDVGEGYRVASFTMESGADASKVMDSIRKAFAETDIPIQDLRDASVFEDLPDSVKNDIRERVGNDLFGDTSELESKFDEGDDD